MTDYLQPLTTALADFGWRDVADIVILAVIVYGIVKIMARTRAMRVVLGLGVLLLFVWIAQVLNLVTLTWVFSWLLQALAIFVVILFQPEIRRALEKIGSAVCFRICALSILTASIWSRSLSVPSLTWLPTKSVPFLSLSAARD